MLSLSNVERLCIVARTSLPSQAEDWLGVSGENINEYNESFHYNHTYDGLDEEIYGFGRGYRGGCASLYSGAQGNPYGALRIGSSSYSDITVLYCNTVLSVELPSFNSPTKMSFYRTQGVTCDALFWNCTRRILYAQHSHLLDCLTVESQTRAVGSLSAGKKLAK